MGPWHTHSDVQNAQILKFSANTNHLQYFYCVYFREQIGKQIFENVLVIFKFFSESVEFITIQRVYNVDNLKCSVQLIYYSIFQVLLHHY